MCGVDGNAALTLFRSLIDHVVIHEISAALFSENLGDSGGKGGFAVVNVADGANVNMRLVTLKLLFSHLDFPP